MPAPWLLAACTALALAQLEPVQPVAKFWEDDNRIAVGGAAEMVGIREPFAALAMRIWGKKQIVWHMEAEPPLDHAPDLDRALLDRVKDNHSLPVLAGRERKEWRPWEAANYDVFCDALRAVALPPEAAKAFTKSAAENRGVAWGDLFREPWKYRGKVIPVKGRLKMLRQRDTPVPVQRDGIETLYEGWVFTDTPGANPVVVDFVKLPRGMNIGEKVDYPVAFNGYFLMRYRYLTSGRGWRDTLLFVAPTLAIRPGARDSGPGAVWGFGSMSGAILTGMVGLVAVTVVLVALLGLWFRRGDRRVRAHLSQVQAGMFNESALAEDQPPGPTVTAVRPDEPPGSGPGFEAGGPPRPDGPRPTGF